MKIVMKEWLKDKYACWLFGISFILKSIYLIVNARIVIMVSELLSDLGRLTQNLSVLVAVLVFQALISSLCAVTRRKATYHCYMTMSNRYANKMLDADVEMFIKFSTSHITTVGEFIHRVISVGEGLMRFATNIIFFVATLYSMYTISGVYVIPVVLVYLVGTILMRGLWKMYTKYDCEVDRCTKKKNQLMEDLINGFSEIRIFNQQQSYRAKIGEITEQSNTIKSKRSTMDAIIILTIEVIEAIGFMIVVCSVTWQMMNGQLNPAQGMSLVILVFRLMDPILGMLDFTSNLAQDLSMHDDYNQIISYENRYDDKGSMKLDSFKEGISIRNLHFAYNSSNYTLNGVNMEIKKGQKVGICGSSGCGKTTIFKLLSKFYTASDGSILVDGINIDDITTDSYRKHVGVVQQENCIFPTTIRENILCADPNATEYELIEACKKANLYEFIMSLPEKFNTHVGTRGLTLSGGQKQRIAIARLMLTDPEIVLLDEATSALDNESEDLIQESIDAMKDKTIVTIAHRLSTIKNCDVIYMIDNGQVVESGTHEELIALHGKYYAMTMRRTVTV